MCAGACVWKIQIVLVEFHIYFLKKRVLIEKKNGTKFSINFLAGNDFTPNCVLINVSFRGEKKCLVCKLASH